MMAVIILLVSIWLFLFSPRDCLAQSFSVSIDPPILEAMIQPGKKIIYTFDLKNHSSQTVNLVVEIVPFEAGDDQGHIRLLTGEQPPDFFTLLNSDLNFGQPFSLAPDQKIQLVFLLSIPSNQPEGDYYQTVLVSQVSETNDSLGNRSWSLGAVGANILLTVSQSGQPRVGVDIASFTLKDALFGRIIDSFAAASFDLRLINTGEAFLKPEGSIFVRSEKEGADLQKITIRPDNILPGTTRQMVCLEEPCSFRPDRLIGVYQAGLELIVGEEKYQSAVTFWVFPVKISLVLLGLLIISLIGFWQLRKKE